MTRRAAASGGAHSVHCRPADWLGQVLGAMLLAAPLAGCWTAPAGVVPVEGRVTLDGQPLSGATVTFQPRRDPSDSDQGIGGSVGLTDATGRYRLRLIEPDVPGAAAGKHVVTITTATTSGGDAARPSGERVPRVWRNGSQTFVVPAAGTQSADFAILSPK